jgi:hypothetical protein
MTKRELWALYVRRNPVFEAGTAEFTRAGLRRFFEQTYDVAYRQGMKDGGEAGVIKAMGDMFGGRK